MSVQPKKGEVLELYQGSTLDETFTFLDEDDAPLWTDPTGWKAGLVVRGSLDGAALLALAQISSIGTPPSADGIVLAANGVARAYARDETTAAISHETFEAIPQNDGSTTYKGVWDMEVENPAGERWRYFMGSVPFSREVTHG